MTGCRRLTTTSRGCSISWEEVMTRGQWATRRKKKKDRKDDGLSKEKIQTLWTLTQWPPNNKMKQWEKDSALDAEKQDILVGIVPQRGNQPMPSLVLQVMHQPGIQHQWAHQKRWMEKNYTLTSEALQHKWMKRKKKSFWTKLKKRVFSLERCLDIDLSCLGHLLCNYHKNYIKFNIHPYFDKLRWE